MKTIPFLIGGKDYLTYLNSRQDYLRSRRHLDEQRRDLKHDLIQRYFDLVIEKRKVELFGDYFRQTSFVYRFVRERAAKKKTSSAAYYRARTTYLAAQKRYQESLVQNELADEQFALFLGDDLGTNYRQKDRLKFIPMRLPLLDAIQLSLANAPKLLTAKKDLENAGRNYELALKENLPLPKFSVKLGGYTSSFSKDGQTTRYETYPESKNIELVGRFLKSRSLCLSYIGLSILKESL